MKIPEIPLDSRYTGKPKEAQRGVIGTIVAQTGNGSTDPRPGYQTAASLHTQSPRMGLGTPAGVSGSAAGEFEPPPDFAEKIFGPNYLSSAELRTKAEVVTAQFRRDKARELHRRAAAKPTDPDAIAQRDRLQKEARQLSEVYAQIWPGDLPVPFSEQRPHRRKHPKSTKEESLARKVRIMAREVGTQWPRAILQKHPQLAEKYEPFDIERATELAKILDIYYDHRLVLLQRDRWYLQLAQPLQDIEEGLFHLLYGRDALLIPQARALLVDEIDTLSQPESDQGLKEIYERLHYQWPHIVALYEEGKIETARGALAYYRALQARMPRTRY